jgi:hypothetical protein
VFFLIMHCLRLLDTNHDGDNSFVDAFPIDAISRGLPSNIWRQMVSNKVDARERV